MPAKQELSDMALIPKEELGLFKLTHSVELPWVNPVSYWVPTHGDIKAMAAIARSVAEQPTIVDIGCGNAFISHLLAQEVPVIGIDPNEKLLARTPYRHPDLELIVGTAENATKLLKRRSVDVVVSSWMPQGIDLSESLYALNPKAIIFVRDAWGFTGTKKAYQTRDDYTRVVQWSGITTAEIASFFDDVCKELEPFKPHRYYTVNEATNHPRWKNIFERDNGWVVKNDGIAACNVFDIRFRQGIPSLQLPIQIDELLPYPWESNLKHIITNSRIRLQGEGISLNPPVVVKS